MQRMNMKRFVKYMLGAAAAVIAAAVLAVAVVTVGFYGGSSGGSEGRRRGRIPRAPYAARIPDVMADPAERASWFVERFWDGFDFRDTMQLRPERLDPAFGEFASAALYADPAVRDASLRRMLDSAARGGEAALERFASLAEEYFGSAGPVHAFGGCADLRDGKAAGDARHGFAAAGPLQVLLERRCATVPDSGRQYSSLRTGGVSSGGFPPCGRSTRCCSSTIRPARAAGPWNGGSPGRPCTVTASTGGG